MSIPPGPIYDLITLRDWEDALGELSEQVVQKQLAMYAETQRAALERTGQANSLVRLSSIKTIDSLAGPEDIDALRALPDRIKKELSQQVDRLPYPTFCVLRRALIRSGAKEDTRDPRELEDMLSWDVDEWIVSNERALREENGGDWKRGLVDWGAHSHLVFDTSVIANTEAKVISRSSELPGFTFLDEQRVSSITVQPSLPAFQTAFDQMTDGLLEGLDWSHVFVAGGVVLSTLLSVTPEAMQKYVNSDIDLYIFGLGPTEANAKVQHIFDVWKQNLPERAKGEVFVVRNSGTITFFAQWPLKRLQIVLKLVKDPKAL